MWDIVGDDFSHMDLEAFSIVCLSKFINQWVIKLILDKSPIDTIGGWRPITLLSVDYKIMAKGFVQGRFILDTLISSWQVMEWDREWLQQILFLKIDFDKSYERVDWTFIIDMLSFSGFGSEHVGMINTLFFSTSPFLVVNNFLLIFFFIVCLGKDSLWHLIFML